MHPPLGRPYPRCQELIEALNQCHLNNNYAKFWGACNDSKAAMDNCFREEKEARAKLNRAKAKIREEKFNQFLMNEQSEKKK